MQNPLFHMQHLATKSTDFSNESSDGPINLLGTENILPESEAFKYIKVSTEINSNKEKKFYFYDQNDSLIYEAFLTEGGYCSKSFKGELVRASGPSMERTKIEAIYKLCSLGNWKTAQLRDQNDTHIGSMEMKFPLHYDSSFVSDEGLAVMIKNVEGQILFKIKMVSGPYAFEVLSTAYGKGSVGKIHQSQQLSYNCFSNTLRNYTFEYSLPLDSATISMILCGIMGLATSYADQVKRQSLIILILFVIIIFFIIMIWMEW